MWLPIFIFIFLPLYNLKADESNAGIVQGVWYDQELFFVGEPVRIYVAVRNNTGADLKGAVEFFVNGERIERNFIDALDGRIVESWADWTAGYGTSTVSATLSRTEISSTASGTKSVTLTSAIAEDLIFVDYDTDKDNIGNANDPDDDGDKVSDKDEEARGTDPLQYDEPEEEDLEVETNDEAGSGGKAAAPEASHDSNNRPGLEQFLTDNRAGQTLSSVTDFINTSKEKIDEYRANRLETKNQAHNESTTTSNNENTASGTSPTENSGATTSHIGEITRSSETSGGNFSNLTKNIFNGVKALVAFAYDTVLFLMSKFLAYPILVQLTLLFLILFLILKLAQRFSKRQY